MCIINSKSLGIGKNASANIIDTKEDRFTTNICD